MVLFASRHGATKGIAERIAATLRAAGLQTRVEDARVAPDPGVCDALVIGSAAYMGKWLDEATRYVERHRVAIERRPTWLFSSGPVGTDRLDKKGNDVLAPPDFLRRLADKFSARGIRVFFGRWDPADPPASLAERLFQKLSISKDVLPVGDFRDWSAIDAWAKEIARALAGEAVVASGRTAS
jgi:menaquinone-dependent protoporphyrinogen oxidase